MLDIETRGLPDRVALTLEGLFNDGRTAQVIKVADQAGRPLGGLSALGGDASQSFVLDLSRLPRRDRMILRLTVARPMSPRPPGQGGARPLGFALKSLRIDPLP